MSNGTSVEFSVRVLGGGQDVGRSCMLLTMGERRILLDCGAHPGFADARRFPDLASLPPLDVVLITHFHLDHAGALPQLRALQRQAADGVPPPPIVMTKPTRKLTALMLRDFCDTSTSRRQNMPFTSDDVRTALDAVVEVELDQEYSPPCAPDINICAHYAGHVLGAVMFRVSVRSVGCVVYSGDYTTSPDSLLRASDIPIHEMPVDLFITEATYCSTIRRAPRSASESELFDAIAKTLESRGKVLIPVAALGRAQDMIAALTPLWTEGDDCGRDLSHVPIYIAAGLMSKAAAVYDMFPEWATGCGTDCKRRMPQLSEFNRSRDWARITEEGPMVLFATPGSLSSGVSYDVFRAWAGEPRNLVVVPGFCFANTLAARVLAGAKHSDGIADIRCRLMNMSFSAHADARGIVRTVRRLSPRAVMLCHGEASKIAAYQPRLRHALGGGVPVYAPANGDVVKLEARRFGSKKISKKQKAFEEFVKEGVDAKWQVAIDRFVEGPGEQGKSWFGPGSAQHPVDDGVTVFSQLYAQLLPDAQFVNNCPTHLRYKGCVDVVLNSESNVAKLEWVERIGALEAKEVWKALKSIDSGNGDP